MGDMTRREAMKTAMKASAYAAPVVLATVVPSAVSAASLGSVGAFQFVVLSANGRDITFLTCANSNTSVQFNCFPTNLPVGTTGTLTGACTATLGFPAGTVFTVKSIFQVGAADLGNGKVGPLLPFPPGVYARPGSVVIDPTKPLANAIGNCSGPTFIPTA